MSLLFSSVVIQTTRIILEAGRRVMELQKGGGCFQGGEKGLEAPKKIQYSQGRICTSPDQTRG